MAWTLRIFKTFFPSDNRLFGLTSLCFEINGISVSIRLCHKRQCDVFELKINGDNTFVPAVSYTCTIKPIIYPSTNTFLQRYDREHKDKQLFSPGVFLLCGVCACKKKKKTPTRVRYPDCIILNPIETTLCMRLGYVGTYIILRFPIPFFIFICYRIRWTGSGLFARFYEVRTHPIICYFAHKVACTRVPTLWHLKVASRRSIHHPVIYRKHDSRNPLFIADNNFNRTYVW